MDEQALREQFEAQAREIAESYFRPQSLGDAAQDFAESLRKMGIPAVGAHMEGTTLVADLAEPAGEG